MSSSPASHPLGDGRTSSSALITALRGQRPERTPVWFMRQAGRSLPEYRALRVGTAMLDACLDPELASEITLQPVRRHGVDAAVFFSDIVIPLRLAGVPVEIVAGRGPVLESPIRSASDILRLRPIDPDALAPIREGVARTVAELGSTPLIGFAGAPFTLASYLVEGGPSKDQLRARSLMVSDPNAWAQLLNWCADVSGAFLRAQVEAGASAVQLFDSWVGSLSRQDYQRRVAPHSRRTLSALRGLDMPIIHFGVGSGEVLDLMAGIGVERRRRGLATAARRGLPAARGRRGRAGQHRSRAADRPVGGSARPRARRARARPVGSGARGQPRVTAYRPRPTPRC